MKLATVAAVATLVASGCYLSHEGGGTSPRDSSADTRRGRDGGPDTSRPDTAPPPPACEGAPWVRTDLGTFPGTRIGAVGASETTIAWIGTNTGDVTLTRLDRRTLELSRSPLSPEYSQDAAVHWTGESFVIAFEHTGPMGTNEGLFITVAEDGIGGSIRPPIQLSPTGGDPSIASGLSPESVLVAWWDFGAVMTEYGIEIGEPLRELIRLDDDSRLAVTAARTPTHYLVGHARRIRRVDPVTFADDPFRTTSASNFVRRLVSNELAVAVEYVGGRVESFTFDGDTIATDRPEGDDIVIAGFGEHFFGINRRTGESAIVNPEFSVEFDPGDFVPDLASVNHAPNGFVVLSAPLPVGNTPLVSLIERCE